MKSEEATSSSVSMLVYAHDNMRKPTHTWSYLATEHTLFRYFTVPVWDLIVEQNAAEISSSVPQAHP